MPALTVTYLSSNEVSLGNTSAIQFLCKGVTLDLPVGATIFMEDAGTYEIRTIGTADYASEYFAIIVENRLANDGTPNRVILNRQAEITTLRDNLLAGVDVEAETFRHQFITPGSGQSMTYEEKYAEAQLYLANSEIADAEIPHIIAEIGITGADKNEVAQAIVEMRNQWKTLSAEIEKIRLGRKKEIGEAETVEALGLFGPVDFSAALTA